MGHDVLISYSSKDDKWANAICNRLEANNIRVWVAPRDIVAGRSYAAEINRAIRETKCVVLIFNKNSYSSQWVRKEVERAVNSNKIIIPFRIDNVSLDDEWDLYISSAHWLDVMNKEKEEAIGELLGCIKKLLCINTVEKQPVVQNNYPKVKEVRVKKYSPKMTFSASFAALFCVILLLYIFVPGVQDIFSKPAAEVVENVSSQKDNKQDVNNNTGSQKRNGINNKQVKETEKEKLPVKTGTLKAAKDVKVGNYRRNTNSATDARKKLNLAVNQLQYKVVYFNKYISRKYETGLELKNGEREMRVDTIHPFCMTKYEVSQFQWETIMGTNPSKNKGASKPVDNVSYSDVMTFISKLNKLSNKKFRLPTAKEWELAAYGLYFPEWRNGDADKFKKEASKKMNYVSSMNSWGKENSGLCSHDVGKKKPNANGMYDMFGNVWEFIDMAGENNLLFKILAMGGSFKSIKKENPIVEKSRYSYNNSKHLLIMNHFLFLMASDDSYKSPELGFRLVQEVD